MIRARALPLICASLAAVASCVSRKPATMPATHAAAPLRVRVLTYNIHHGAGEDKRIDLPRIAELIRRAQPDLVALQEVDRKTTRVNGVDQTAELGRLTGLYARFGKAMDYQGGEFGQAILSRWPIATFSVEHLPDQPNAEPRIAAIATIASEGDRPAIVFASTHLDHQHEASRIPQAHRLSDVLFSPNDALKILAGDFNAVPGSETMQVIAEHWTSATADDALSYPAPTPARKIDWVLVPNDPRWRVIRAQVLDEAIASDHRPVLVELEFGG